MKIAPIVKDFFKSLVFDTITTLLITLVVMHFVI